MNKREKILAAAVGILVLLLALNYVASRVQSSFQVRNREIEKLEKEIRNKNRVIRMGGEKRLEIARYEQRSLPKNPGRASSAYRAWLLHLLEDRAGLSDPNVVALPGRPHGDVYTEYQFMVDARGNLAQLTEFLFEFYRVDHLHRIGMMALTPIKDSKDLDVKISIDALALPGSTNEDDLTVKLASRLNGELDDYLGAVVRRNCFSPPNKPPVLTADAKGSYYDDETISFTARGSDPDGDSMTYRLGENSPPGAQIDARSGRVTFRPEEQGEYEICILAEDSGLPAKSAEYTAKFAVTERPPAPVVETTPQTPAFDPSKFAFLTGITENAGRPELWIHIRTEGRLLKLHVGEQFEVGAMKGVVTHIGAKHCELDANGQRMTVALGKSLHEAVPSPLGQ